MLVLLICVGQYDSEDADSLPRTQNDKTRLYQLFHDIYGDEVMQNESSRVTENDMDDILLKAKQEFKKKEKQYKGIMVFYSGHGDLNNDMLLVNLSLAAQDYHKHNISNYETLNTTW